MVAEYTGPSNSPEMLQFLVGREIRGCMLDGTHLVIVLDTGRAFVLTSLGGETRPSFWMEDVGRVRARVEAKRRQLERLSAEIGNITRLHADLGDEEDPFTQFEDGGGAYRSGWEFPRYE